MSNDKDYYRVLEVMPTATPEVIRAAYRALASKFHPDKGHVTAQDNTMAELNEAFQVLSCPQKRSVYDDFRSKNQSGTTGAYPYMNRQAANSYSRTIYKNYDRRGVLHEI